MNEKVSLRSTVQDENKHKMPVTFCTDLERFADKTLNVCDHDEKPLMVEKSRDKIRRS